MAVVRLKVTVRINLRCQYAVTDAVHPKAIQLVHQNAQDSEWFEFDQVLCKFCKQIFVFFLINRTCDWTAIQIMDTAEIHFIPQLK